MKAMVLEEIRGTVMMVLVDPVLKYYWSEINRQGHKFTSIRTTSTILWLSCCTIEAPGIRSKEK